MNEKLKTFLQAMIFPTIGLIGVSYGYYTYLNRPSVIGNLTPDIEVFPIWLFVVISLISYICTTGLFYWWIKNYGFWKKK